MTSEEIKQQLNEQGFYEAIELIEYLEGENLKGAKYSAQYQLASQMIPLFAALISAYKKENPLIFWATVENAKAVLRQYINFDNEDWEIFRSK